MNAAADLNPAELAALLHFYADAGVDWLMEDEPADRFAEFAAQKAAREQARMPASARDGGQQAGQQRSDGGQPSASPQDRAQDRTQATGQTARQGRNTPAAASLPAASPQSVAIPDGEAVASARMAADSAHSFAELRAAVEAFNGCNLKNGARSTVFASGHPASRIMVIGPMPNAEDDRDGQPFSGRQGQLLDRMLGAIGLSRDNVVLTNVIPWRPPGNRMPSPAELDICQPFLERQIALVEPKHVLLLGNFPARYLFGGNDTIHSMRGEWRDVRFGACEFKAIATLHPQDLITAPGNKALAWRDLLTFRLQLNSP
ncbi:MAG: uracil-DNA glycosylase [Neorhizobium sp.]|nr:uracil-DNA glycosylase [Neorhizobium sp.]